MEIDKRQIILFTESISHFEYSKENNFIFAQSIRPCVSSDITTIKGCAWNGSMACSCFPLVLGKM